MRRAVPTDDRLTLAEVDHMSRVAARSIASGVYHQVRGGSQLTGDAVLNTFGWLIDSAFRTMRENAGCSHLPDEGVTARAWWIMGHAFLDHLGFLAERDRTSLQPNTGGLH